MKDFTPDWAKGIIWYQIMPERFRNSIQSVYPPVQEQEGTYPFDTSQPWQPHPWGSDWYKMQPWEKVNGKGLWHNIRRRRYGGDLQGVIDKLDYLKELGVGGLYLNPIFYAPSHHHYDAKMLHHVDPYFGPSPEEDKRLIAIEIPDDPGSWHWTAADLLFLELLKQAHSRGMYVIIDGVFNHIGMMSFAFQDVLKNGKSSRFADWFMIDWNLFEKDPGSKFYRSWCSVFELPEFRKTGKLKYELFENECKPLAPEGDIAPGPKSYIFNVTRRWMRPIVNGKRVDGVDGWRLDVAWFIGKKFWKQWRELVKSLNPTAFITGEVFEKNEIIAEYLQGDQYDSIMNYDFARLSAKFFIYKGGKSLKPSDFERELTVLRSKFPAGVNLVMQNLFDSHDTARILSQIRNSQFACYCENDDDINLCSREQNPQFDIRKPNGRHYKLFKLMLIFQFTYIGAPYIYYGDEVGMWGASDPCCRKPMIWDGIEYEDECFDPPANKKETQSLRRKDCDKVSINYDLLEHYKKLAKIHNQSPELKIGGYETIATLNEQGIFAFMRTSENGKIAVILNRTEQTQTINLNLNGDFYDLLNDEKLQLMPTAHLTIKPLWGRILKKL